MKTRWKFRFYPTKFQRQVLSKTFGCCRFVYNWALNLRTESYKNGISVGYHESSSKLTLLKQEVDKSWLNEVSSVPIQQSLRHLQTAFSNFFSKRTKYPRFKKKSHEQFAEFTRAAFKWDFENRQIRISSLGHINVSWSRKVTSEPTTATITQTPSGKYFISLCLDIPEPDKLPKTGQSVGVDLGINRLATLSTGERIPNPRYLGRDTKKLKHAQQILSRRTKGSGRWNRQRVKVARIHEHISNSRTDMLHKLTTNLVRRFDMTCIEDLNVRGMTKNHSLARSLSDVALGTFRSMIEYKADWYGRELRVVDCFFPSSKMCSKCGHVLEKLPLDCRTWICPICSTEHDRDDNASANILAAGQAVTARGEIVRPVKSSGLKGKSRRSVNHLSTSSG